MVSFQEVKSGNICQDVLQKSPDMLTRDRCIPSDVPKVKSSRLRWYDGLVSSHTEVDACTQEGRAKLLTFVRAEEMARREAARGKPVGLLPAQPVPDLFDVLEKTATESVPERTTENAEHVVLETDDEVSLEEDVAVVLGPSIPESSIQEEEEEVVLHEHEADSPQTTPREPALPHAVIPDTDIPQNDEETTREVTRMKVTYPQSPIADPPTTYLPISLPDSATTDEPALLGLSTPPTYLPPSPPPSPPPLPSLASIGLPSTPTPITAEDTAGMGNLPSEGDTA